MLWKLTRLVTHDRERTHHDTLTDQRHGKHRPESSRDHQIAQGPREWRPGAKVRGLERLLCQDRLARRALSFPERLAVQHLEDIRWITDDRLWT